MSIIVQDQSVSAQLSCRAGALDICFADPAYVRAEQVLIDRASGTVGILFEQGYHALGTLPAGVDMASLTKAHLSGEAHGLRLSAPIKIS